MRYDHMTDEELSILLATNDQMAFTEIYSRYWEVLYRHALKLTANEEVSEDIIQDIFLGLLRNMRNISPEFPIKSYLYSCVRKRIINAIRNDKVRSNHLEKLRRIPMGSTFITDAVLLEREFHSLLNRELEKLPKQVKTVFELSRMEHLSRKEISIHTGTSEGTIKKQLSLALRVLRTKLAILR